MHVFFFRYIYKCEGMYVCIYICNFGYADWGTPNSLSKTSGGSICWWTTSLTLLQRATCVTFYFRSSRLASKGDEVWQFSGKASPQQKTAAKCFLAILIDGTLLNMSSFSLLNVNVYLDKIYCWLRAVVPMIAFENQVFSITFPTEKVCI